MALKRRTATESPAQGRRDVRELKALGAYIFAGTFTLGVGKHFKVLGHLEDGPFGTATAAANFPGMPIHDDPDSWPVEDFAGVDLIYANPPCAPWSQANGKSYHGWKEDPRTSCVTRAFGLMKQLRPKVWTFESVRGAFTKGRPMMDELAKEANRLGYQVTHLLTDGLECGIAQNRRRYFFVAHRVAIDWPKTGKKHLTVADAIRGFKLKGDVGEKMPARFDGIIDEVKQGQRLRDVFDAKMECGDVRMERNEHGGVRGRPGFLIWKLRWDRPSATITGSATKIHPDEPRFITMGESKALCGIPQSFKYVGTISQQYAQLAKAVMPPTAEYLAAQLAAAIRRGRPADPSRTDVVSVYSDRVETKELEHVEAQASTDDADATAE